jgi:hypothetical protein
MIKCDEYEVVRRKRLWPNRSTIPAFAWRGGTEENNVEPWSEYSVFWPTFELDTSLERCRYTTLQASAPLPHTSSWHNAHLSLGITLIYLRYSHCSFLSNPSWSNIHYHITSCTPLRKSNWYKVIKQINKHKFEEVTADSSTVLGTLQEKPKL